MEQKRIKVRLIKNSPYSDYGNYQKGDIGYVDGYSGSHAVIVLENGKFAKADLRWIEVVNEKDNNVNTELEGEDEKIRKFLINEVMGHIGMLDLDGDRIVNNVRNNLWKKSLAWLEKQGKQESVTCPICGWKIEKQGEQKPAGVEPKFKVGDWLVNVEYSNVVRVFDVSENNYKLEYDGDTIGGGLCIEVIDNDYRLWTIQDAKDGDILVCDVNQRPFIFKGLLDPKHLNCPVAYCGIDIEGNCCVSKHNNWWTDCNVRPATKEQRDTLMKAMADAGYTFDFEKKELKLR